MTRAVNWSAVEIIDLTGDGPDLEDGDSPGTLPGLPAGNSTRSQHHGNAQHSEPRRLYSASKSLERQHAASIAGPSKLLVHHSEQKSHRPQGAPIEKLPSRPSPVRDRRSLDIELLLGKKSVKTFCREVGLIRNRTTSTTLASSWTTERATSSSSDPSRDKRRSLGEPTRRTELSTNSYGLGAHAAGAQSSKRRADGSIKTNVDRQHNAPIDLDEQSEDDWNEQRLEEAFGLRHTAAALKKPAAPLSGSSKPLSNDFSKVGTIYGGNASRSRDLVDSLLPSKSVQSQSFSQKEERIAATQTKRFTSQNCTYASKEASQQPSSKSLHGSSPFRIRPLPKSEHKEATHRQPFPFPPTYDTRSTYFPLNDARSGNLLTSDTSYVISSTRKLSRPPSTRSFPAANEVYEPELQTIKAVLASELKPPILPLFAPTRHHAPANRPITRAHRPRSSVARPYLSFHVRQRLRGPLSNGVWDHAKLGQWKSQCLHVDFPRDEMLEIVACIRAEIGLSDNLALHQPQAIIQKALKNADEAQIARVAWRAVKRPGLSARTRDDIESFLGDAEQGRLRPNASIDYVGPVDDGSRSARRKTRSVACSLRERELGVSRRYGNSCAVPSVSIELRNSVNDSLGPSLSFTGTSGDVGTVAWAPDGNTFAAGSVCLVDRDSMQYNRPNNLLVGDVQRNALQELPDHFVRRQLQDTGSNASHSMHVSQDPRLFMTVPMVAFSPDGSFMYSAGYDSCVRAWTVGRELSETKCRYTFRHRAAVDVLAVSKSGLLASGCQSVAEKSIRVIRCDPEKAAVVCTFSSKKAVDRPETRTFPTSLRWDPTSSGTFLLAGFSCDAKVSSATNYGEVCLWNVQRQEQCQIVHSGGSVFDCAWNPIHVQQALFSVAGVAGSNVNRGTRSVVRMYDLRVKYGMMMELECPALDMNDVLYCPHDENFIATSCTDGQTYIWDLRSHQGYLHALPHGQPLMESDDTVSREEADTGVRFCAWGENRTRFYTGSSDGVVKAWDMYRAPEDAFIKDVVRLNSGVMSGEFSPDYSRLLIGEVNGSVNVMETGFRENSLRDMKRLQLLDAPETQGGSNQSVQGAISADSGIAAARELLWTMKLAIRPFGGFPVQQAVQGPKYESGGGPIDKAADSPALRLAASEFQQRLLNGADGKSCRISGCVDHVKYTSEETGDSGRWRERIPGELRQHNPSSQQSNSPAAMKVCKRCRRLTRPIDDTIETRCERCGFACFRCGRRIKLRGQVERVKCWRCELVWRADALGYTLVESGGSSRGPSTSQQKKPAEAQLQPRKQSYQSSSDGAGQDEDGPIVTLLKEVQDHHHSFWTDRPPS